MSRQLHIGLLGAMPEEIGSDLSHLQDLSCSTHGDLTLHKGSLSDTIRLTLAWSGWGKVSAARAATRLLASDPSIDLLVFTVSQAQRIRACVNGMCCWPKRWCSTTWMPSPYSHASRCQPSTETTCNPIRPGSMGRPRC